MQSNNNNVFDHCLNIFSIFRGLIFMLSVSVYLNFTVCLYTQIDKMTCAVSSYSDLFIEFEDKMIILELPRFILFLILFAECCFVQKTNKNCRQQLNKQLNRCCNDSEKVYQSVADKCIAPSKNNNSINYLLDSNFEKASNKSINDGNFYCYLSSLH